MKFKFGNEKMLINKNRIKEQLNLWIPLFLSSPLMISHLFMIFTNSMFPIAFYWYSFVAASITIFWFGKDFYIESFKEIIFERRIGMSTLVTISSWLAFFYSTYILIDSTINNISHFTTFFDIAATIIAIVILGGFVSTKIQERSSKDIDKIFTLQVAKASKLNLSLNKFEDIETKFLRIGDIVQVKKGEKIPIDGHIVDNKTQIDESLITGEALPIVKDKGDKVIGGSINVGSVFMLKVSSLYNDTILNKIIESVKITANSKIKAVKIVDKISMWFTPIVIICAILAFLLNAFIPNFDQTISNNSGFFGSHSTFTHDWQKGLYFFIATISIACPCALGIAAPLATFVGVSKGAKNGIIFNNIEAFDKIKKINMVAFDKTGTLTKGKFNVVEFIGSKKNIPIILKLESISFHPISKSFIKYCEKEKIENLKNDKLVPIELIGTGIEEKNYGYLISSLKYAMDKKFKIKDSIKEKLNSINDSALLDTTMRTIVAFSKNKIIENVIVFEDEIRENAFKTIQALKKAKIDVCMITGDNEKNATHVAKILGIKNLFWNVQPNDKANIIKKIQDENKKVAYVGDGINDLIALQQSDLSFSMTNDNEAAKSISDINLLDLNIANIYKTILLTRQTRLAIFANMWWAFGYNMIVIPLAILAFIPPIFSVFIMMTSDITVSLNSLIYKWKKIKSID